MAAKTNTNSTASPLRRGDFRYPLLLGFLLGALGMWLVYDHAWLFGQFGGWFGDGSKPTATATADVKRQPDYVFYTELSEQEVVVLEEELVDLPTATPKSRAITAAVVASLPAVQVAAKAKPKSEGSAGANINIKKSTPVAVQYILQAGSFRLPKEADSLRARLSLAGFRVRIQTVQIDGATTWHRVRVGPYSSKQKLQQARRRLQQQGIQPLALRLKPQR